MKRSDFQFLTISTTICGIQKKYHKFWNGSKVPIFNDSTPEQCRSLLTHAILLIQTTTPLNVYIESPIQSWSNWRRVDKATENPSTPMTMDSSDSSHHLMRFKVSSDRCVSIVYMCIQVCSSMWSVVASSSVRRAFCYWRWCLTLWMVSSKVLGVPPFIWRYRSLS